MKDGTSKHNTSMNSHRYKLQTILENNDIKLYWGRTIPTDHTITCKRADVTLTDKENGRTYLIEISISD